MSLKISRGISADTSIFIHYCTTVWAVQENIVLPELRSAMIYYDPALASSINGPGNSLMQKQYVKPVSLNNKL